MQPARPFEHDLQPSHSHRAERAKGRSARPSSVRLESGVMIRAEALIERARANLVGQSAALLTLSESIDESFARAVELILSRPGRVIVCGIGKSGHIGRKLAATLASTGTPAFFLHPSEAQHGDLGMVTEEDTMVMISNSGRTKEILAIVPTLRDLGVPIVALCGGGNLSEVADVSLCIGVDREVCPLNLAPTTSTLVTLALGDALAIALSQARGFQALDFARVHPGGELGRRLCTRVRDVMRTDDLPVVEPGVPMSEVLSTITQGRLGLAIVQDAGRLLGVITDGDLRRALQDKSDFLQRAAEEVMTRDPITIREDAQVIRAEKLMEQKRVKALLVVDGFDRLSGVIEFFAR